MTTASAVPAVIDALVTMATAAVPSGTVVSDGLSFSGEVGNYLMIGVEDPEVELAQRSARTAQEWPHAGTGARDEKGEITCAALSWTGDSGPTSAKAARDACYATADALSAALRANPSLGVDSVLYASYGTGDSLSQAQDKHGAYALLIFRVAFHARLTS